MTPTKDLYADALVQAQLPLGKLSEYKDQYDPSQLRGVARELNRNAINLSTPLPFSGGDFWTGYELSWLNAKGKPVVAIAKFIFNFDSINIVESKSFKLYLNSFNLTRFDSTEMVKQALIKDLSACSQSNVKVDIVEPTQFNQQQIKPLVGTCIDNLDIEVNDYNFNPDYLINSSDNNNIVMETLSSNLLKSNCLITSQPDWGSIVIRYQGAKIDPEKLLRYLVSFRQHNEFHEQCIERIFVDLKRFCHCQKLTVYACYTRRGGIDINPYRSDFEAPSDIERLARQ